ncbi:MAG: FAD-dependent oxidoreductase [Bacilli bacterium]
MKLNFDVIIIGCGVAGMSAAIYLKRAKVNCLLLEKMVPGGQIIKSSTVENYPGFLKVTGAEFSEKVFEQIKSLDVPYKYGNVLEIIDNGEYKTVKTDLEEITCKNIIIATGRTFKLLGINKEEEYIGHGISYCATCDGTLYKSKDVIVIGGGNTSLEETIYLSNICKSVNIIHRKDNFTGELGLIDKVKACSNVNYYFNSIAKDLVVKDNKIIGLNVLNLKTKEELVVNSEGIFIFIGYRPDSNFLTNLDILDNDGYVIVDEKMKTKIDGIYAAGDIVKKDLFQIITAAADGANAANSIIKSTKR